MRSPARQTARLHTRFSRGWHIALALMGVLLAGCSIGGEYPAVGEKPAARSEQPMTPEEVKAATDALISERNRQQASGPANPGNAGNATKP